MNVIIFDTETIGKVSQDLLNVGYKIIDIDIQQALYLMLNERDYLVRGLIDNKVYCLNDDFVGAGKYSKYVEALASKKAIKRNIKQIFTTLANDIKKHKVLFGFAYNCNFDIDKFNKTAEKYGIENPLKDLPIFDIWGYAYQYICNTPEYIEWAKANNLTTESGCYIPTSVEAVCKYLYNNLDFIEDHTALSDVQHETNILMECVKRGCDITRALPRAKFIPSGKVFNKVIQLPNGELIEIEYTKQYERNNKITYKM
jgi:hypothetical protein